MKLLGILLILLLSLPARAQTTSAQALQPWSYHDYQGTIDGKLAVRMSLYLNEDGSLQGHYFYTRFLHKIRLTGKLQGAQLTLSELDEQGQTRAIFSGSHGSGEQAVLRGKWQDLRSKRVLPFELVQYQIIRADWNHRYGSMGVSDDQAVEDFAARVRQALLQRDYAWIEQHLARYANLSGITYTPGDHESYMRRLRLGMNQPFLEAIKADPAIDLFSNASGCMLANGQVWINYVPIWGDHYELRILAINLP